MIFDMDGTLCDVRSIRHFVEEGAGASARDFMAFHDASINCPPFPHVLALLKAASRRSMRVLIVTGREDRWSFHTTLWLAENDVPFDDIYMRPRGDYRSDALLKADFARAILRQYRPLLAVDDRDDIIEVWANAGIPTAKVTEAGTLVKADDVGAGW
ncbi:hypothetical protein FVA74_00895 [Salinibacterium sp. dk2585]|uniref:phosphatase domain-containing protein n=1 Tax=unclassified Salinibacterium TaxID=2632331 RepID=UPI0011C253F9|nr:MULTISPECIES: hypothetical protein [unclassified Salinibacterium]QEE60280.1 hypothetical protein FVA74_00895 [Salinibacterium sp. dk2585]TXK55352.1 hypothetical protein FVP63_01040 [Salinibacterium sp. dk5596]